MAKNLAYDFLVPEATQDVRYLRPGDPVVLYGDAIAVPPGKTPEQRLADHDLPARPYVVVRGEEPDEHGLPTKWIRGDRYEIEPADPFNSGRPRKVKKVNKPKRPEIPERGPSALPERS